MARYDSAFGSPVSRVQGIGYIQEMVARLTQTPIATHNSSTNATLDDDPITFPLNHNLYVDATHEVVVLNSAFRLGFTPSFPRIRKDTDPCFRIVITALNLSSFAAAGPLPSDHIPSYRTFRSSQLSPFSTNIQFQRAYFSPSSSPRPILPQNVHTNLNHHEILSLSCPKCSPAQPPPIPKSASSSTTPSPLSPASPAARRTNTACVPSRRSSSLRRRLYRIRTGSGLVVGIGVSRVGRSGVRLREIHPVWFGK